MNLQEECQKLNEKIHTMQQSLVLEKEARTQDKESSLYESNKLHGKVALLEQEVEKLRTCTQDAFGAPLHPPLGRRRQLDWKVQGANARGASTRGSTPALGAQLVTCGFPIKPTLYTLS